MADWLWFEFRLRTAPGAGGVLGTTFGSYFFNKTEMQRKYMQLFVALVGSVNIWSSPTCFPSHQLGFCQTGRAIVACVDIGLSSKWLTEGGCDSRPSPSDRSRPV